MFYPNLGKTSAVIVKRLFDKANRDFDKSPSQPPCLCHQADLSHGTVVHLEGHVAFIPVRVTLHDNSA